MGDSPLTAGTDLTDAQIAGMTGEELDAWYDARSVGPWEPNANAGRAPARTTTSITVRMPDDLLAELKAEAARRGQPYQRCMKDLLLLALRQAQAGRRPPAQPAQVRLTDDQLRALNEQGEVTVRLRGPVSGPAAG